MKLPPDTLADLFPFRVEVESDGLISGLGRSIQKACPELEIGQAFIDAFSPFRPPEPFDLGAIRSQTQTLFIIKTQLSGLSLRGQIIPTEEGGFVYLGSPWFSDSNELGQRGLTMDDFAIHDPAVDLLYILRAQQMATNDLKKLTEKLRGQRTQLKEANARLTAQEAEQRRLALIAERTDNGVILTDPEGRTQWVNAGFTRLTGYTLDEVTGKVPGHFLQGPGTDPETVSFIKSQILARKPFQVEILNYHKSGRRYWVAFEVQPLFDDDGELLHFMAVENDTTAKRTAEANRRAQFQVSQLLTQASDFKSVAEDLLIAIGSELSWDGGLLWMAKDGDSAMASVSRWNQLSSAKAPAAPEILTKKDKLAGAAWGQETTIWIEELDPTSSDTPRIQELHEMGFRSAVAVPIRIAGNVLGVLELFGRFKESKDNEREQVLTAISSQIAQFFERTQSEKSLQNRSEELVRLNEKLSAASAAKDKFLSNISHEIRTPLNGVIGAADSLEITRLDQDQKEALSTISASASHLHSLLNDVLDLPRDDRTMLSYWLDLQLAWLTARQESISVDRQLHPRVWVGPGVQIHPAAKLCGPCWIGSRAQIGADATVGPNAIVGIRSVVDGNASIENAVVQSDTFVGAHLHLDHMIADGATLFDLTRHTRVELTDRFMLSRLRTSFWDWLSGSRRQS
jgi:PAS domain S-box-containing protein